MFQVMHRNLVFVPLDGLCGLCAFASLRFLPKALTATWGCPLVWLRLHCPKSPALVAFRLPCFPNTPFGNSRETERKCKNRHFSFGFSGNPPFIRTPRSEIPEIPP